MSTFSFKRIDRTPEETGLFRYEITDTERGVVIGHVRRSGMNKWWLEGADIQLNSRHEAALRASEIYGKEEEASRYTPEQNAIAAFNEKLLAERELALREEEAQELGVEVDALYPDTTNLWREAELGEPGPWDAGAKFMSEDGTMETYGRSVLAVDSEEESIEMVDETNGLPKLSAEEEAMLGMLAEEAEEGSESITQLPAIEEGPASEEETDQSPVAAPNEGAGTGECAICGKPLSVAESVVRGIGPVCFQRVVRYLQGSDEGKALLRENLSGVKGIVDGQEMDLDIDLLNPFTLTGSDLTALAPALTKMDDETFAATVKGAKENARKAGRLSYQDVVGAGETPTKEELNKEWIKIGELWQMAVAQGKSGSAVQRAIGGHGNIYPNLSPEWRNFYAHNIHWISRDAISQLDKLPPAGRTPTRDPNAPQPVRAPRQGRQKEVTLTLVQAAQKLVNDRLTIIGELRAELETLQARLLVLPGELLEMENGLTLLEAGVTAAQEEEARLATEAAAAAQKAAEEKAAAAAKAAAEKAAAKEAAKSAKAAARDEAKAAKATGETAPKPAAAPSRKLSAMTPEERLVKLQEQAARAAARAERAAELLKAQAANPANPEVAAAGLTRTASGSYNYADTEEGQKAYAEAAARKAALDAEAAGKEGDSIEQALA